MGAVTRARPFFRRKVGWFAMSIAEAAEVAWVDFHDAELSEVTLGHDGGLAISFSSINVFEKTARPDLFEIWTYRATLVAEGVDDFHSTGTWSADAWVGDLTVDGETPKADPWHLGADGAKHRFALSVVGPVTIRWTGTRATLHLLERLEHLENWEGPLDE